ncbi:M48 family metallopeptidase [Halobium salinum]|uniref:M48 family metallopeptidase n=1 Tax=Halobium salinum TaxID=1364940 RepID=A0ABD5PDT7_9EURY|nr:M48 family metalloprotease [Halobium salinum]
MDWSTDRGLTLRMAGTFALLLAFGVVLSALVGVSVVAVGFGVSLLLAAGLPVWIYAGTAGLAVLLALPLLAGPLSRTSFVGARREVDPMVRDWHRLVDAPASNSDSGSRGLMTWVTAACTLPVPLLVVSSVLFLSLPDGYLSDVVDATVGRPALVLLATAVVFLTAAVFELRLGQRIVSVSGARVVEASTHPRLHRTTTAVAKAYDLPVPRLAVVDTETPEAFVVGFTPSRTTLAVSTSLLERLSDDELRAVAAHELAHVRNRDAAVMTAAAGPLAVADFFYESATTVVELGERGRLPPRAFAVAAYLAVPFVFGLGWLFRGLGGALVASFSRTRELAADRAAVAVTGDGSALASALVSINDALRDRPAEDLRASESLSAMTIISPSSVSDGPIELGAEGEDEAYMLYYEELLRERLFGTHPPVRERVERLRSLTGGLGRH